MNDIDKKRMAEIAELLRVVMKDDPIHLMPVFTEAESKLFKISDDVMVLHIELDADLSEVKDIAKIKYKSLFDENRYTISRDILVPEDIPLHNLHYAINQAFGFTNTHMHEYTLSQEDLLWLTQDEVSRWKRFLGLVFKNPYRDEETDFWDEDYEGGSLKKWMRSKYSGPEYGKIYRESYWYIKEQMKGTRRKISAERVTDLMREFPQNPLAVNEILPVSQILSENGQEDYDGIRDYDERMEDNIKFAARFPKDYVSSQPFVYAFAKTLNYSYNLGDGWDFTIKAFDSVEYLGRRITARKIREAIKYVCKLARPTVIAADGLPLIEDVGGADGYADFLRCINGQPSDRYEDKKECLAWAKENGWSRKIGDLKTIL